MKHRHHIFSLVFAVVLLLPLPVRAITSSYYNSINGQKETALRNALYTITLAGPSGMSYDGLWTAYKTTDVYPSDSTGKAGKIWDMYSDCLFTPTGKGDGKQCGTYSGVCDCFNREHSLPKSWFSEKKPAYYDLGHIVPTDGKVNGMRSNNVFGECASGYETWGTGKLGKAKAVTTTNVKGSSTITTTFTGTAFEPADKYKGDFARMYMYMVIRYKPGNSNSVDLAAAGEGSTMFNSDDTNYGLTDYSIALLMKWHRQDPVSQKEIDRNNGMETTQGNRNPFIDYPCLAEYLWGNKAGQAVTLSELVGTFTGSWTSGDGCPCVGPTITSPTGTVNIGTTNTSNSIYKDVTVQGTNLENSSLILTIGGTHGSYFKLPGGASSTTITKAQAEAGYNITITYTPTANGSHTATLTISGCGVTSHVVTLTGTCTTVYTATWMADGSQVGTSYAASGASPELPASTPSCTSSRVFMGWTAISGYSGNSAPGDLFTTTAPTITTDKTFYAVYADKETSGGGGSSSSASYTFSNKSWAASPSNWTSGKDGNGFSNSGVQVTTGVSGANATCPTSYNSISSIVISYCTNASKGAGSITMTVGSTSVSNNVSTTGGTTPRDLTFDFSSTKPSGAPQITVTCTTNSIYICGVTITYGGGGSTTYSNYSTQCTACTPVAATASYAYPTRTTTCGGSVSNTFTTNSNATVSYTSSNETVATVASDGTVTPVGAGTATITATVPANTCYTGGASASFTLTVNRTSTSASFVSPTTTVGVGSSVTNTVTTESDGTVTYSSDNTSVATVNSSGQVTGKVAGTATITANIAQSSCYNATSASYTITVEAAPEYTVTFMNMGGTHATRTGTAGSAISAVSEPTACAGYTFEGWSTSQYAVDNTSTPSLSTPTTIPAGNVTYYAVYSKTEGSGSSSTSNITASTTLVSGITTNGYTFATGKNGGSSNPTYNTTGGDVRLYAKNQITISASSTITQIVFNLSTQGLKRLAPITASAGTIATQNSGDDKVTWTGSATSVTFTVGNNATFGTEATKAGQLCFTSVDITSGSGSSTIYHTTAPDCSCTATITATSNDDSMGTASVTTP